MSRNAQPQRNWLICYDIGQPRRRRRVAARLEGAGRRLQRSVFLVEGTPERMSSLVDWCRAAVGPQDSVLAYLLIRTDAATPFALVRSALPDFWVC